PLLAHLAVVGERTPFADLLPNGRVGHGARAGGGPKRRSRARVRSSTFTRGSPGKPEGRASVRAGAGARAPPGVAGRRAGPRGASGLRWGSRPLPDALTSSAGTGPTAWGFAAFSDSRSAATRSRSAFDVGPRFDPPDAVGL